MSNCGVNDRPGLASRVPWKIVLPALMASVTALLLFEVPVQLKATRGIDDMPVVSAWGFAWALNGPGFLVTQWLPLSPIHVLGEDIYDAGRLVGVVLFWTWIGRALERRTRRTRRQEPLIRKRWIRALLYLFGLFVAGLCLFETISQIRNDDVWLSGQLWMVLKNHKLRDLMGREIIAVGWLVWGSVYAVYFFRKLLNLRTRVIESQVTN